MTFTVSTRSTYLRQCEIALKVIAYNVSSQVTGISRLFSHSHWQIQGVANPAMPPIMVSGRGLAPLLRLQK